MVNSAILNKFVERQFPHLGINKKREVSRLLYEISKKENIASPSILTGGGFKEKDYDSLKKYLLARRYPCYHNEEKSRFYLPQLQIDHQYKFEAGKFVLRPKKIYVEEAAKHSCLLSGLKDHFPDAEVVFIKSLKDFIQCKTFTIKDYNRRRDSFFLVNERFDFFKECPCSSSCVNCGYHIINLGFGCVYDCSYCFLQEYQNFPGIIIPANLEDYFSGFNPGEIRKGILGIARVGSGEFTDSLALDEVTDFSAQIAEFFGKYPQINFEFKTKSKNIGNLLKMRPRKNIVVSWTLSPQKIIEENEFYTAKLKERIKAMADCAKAGYRIAAHFDPLIYYYGWGKDYGNLADYFLDNVPAKSIAWISLGTLRFNPQLKKVIENRFPGNTMLDEELLLGFDNKMRYPVDRRIKMYDKIARCIKKRSKRSCIYLCMEEKAVWQRVLPGNN